VLIASFVRTPAAARATAGDAEQVDEDDPAGASRRWEIETPVAEAS
jgi:hypothetical protein